MNCAHAVPNRSKIAAPTRPINPTEERRSGKAGWPKGPQAPPVDIQRIRAVMRRLHDVDDVIEIQTLAMAEADAARAEGATGRESYCRCIVRVAEEFLETALCLQQAPGQAVAG